MIWIGRIEKTAIGGGSLVIFFWIVIGSIGVSTAIALVGYKRSKITLSEIAEKLERQAR